ncbi:hypothetical protein L8Q47_15050 [Enterobacter bugandensis]|uniref:hypothetical protein n=1 Tax=Enterobacter bugandensis TaxID=881260 RepID=UPI0020045CE1|nr:hypothetical protein [Enterobacter bugandensis]MCK6946321.1 hypothetical protein [Enterobacter bugandensis]
MKLFEMEGFLRGKCLPGDMKVNETNAEYLVRKFAEADARCGALAAENAGLKQDTPDLQTMMSALDAFFDDEEVPERAMLAAYNILRGAVETPATDAFLAEVRAQGVEMAVDVVKQCYDNICPGGLQENREYEESIVQPHLDGIDDELKEIIDQLRKGVQS